MKRRGKPKRSKRGSVLIACLAVVMVIAALSAMLLQIEGNRARQQIFGGDQKRALNLAEAGLSEGYFSLLTGMTGNVGSITAPARFGNGLFWVTSTELGSRMVSLESTGMCGAGRATLGLVVRLQPVSIASLGVLGAEEVRFGTSALVDSYDSNVSLAPTGVAPDSAGFRVQSNGDIVLGKKAKLNCDATPGPDGSVILGAGARVSGATAPGAASVVLPPIDAPTLPARTYTAPLTGAVTIPSGEGSYASITVPATVTATVQGPATLTVGKLKVADLGVLVFDTTGGPITLYVAEWLCFAKTASVTFAEQDPKRVSLLVSAHASADYDNDLLVDLPVKFDYSGVFYGSLCAPDADLSIPKDFEFFGTISGKSLSVGDAAKIHFDVGLEGEQGGGSSSVQKLSWNVIEVATEVGRTLAADPFKALGLDASTLDTPADAGDGADYYINLVYRDLSNSLQKYNGPEADFDWSQVKSVQKLYRALL